VEFPNRRGANVELLKIRELGSRATVGFVYQLRVPVDLRELVEASKGPPVRPEWEVPDATWFLNAPLDLASGETVQGLELRGGACLSADIATLHVADPWPSFAALLFHGRGRPED